MAIMKFSAKIRLYNSYFDSKDRITAKGILSIFQDVASCHAEEIGVGFNKMYQKKLFWVLSRVKFDVLKMPAIDQVVIVETWPHEKGRADFDRDMKILSESGEVLIIATSKWCVIDTETRALKSSQGVDYLGEVCHDINYEGRFGRLILPNGEWTKKYTHKVMPSDIDHNQHLNNTNYASMVANVIENTSYSHFEINYSSECRLRDSLDIYYQKTDDGEFVIGRNGQAHSFSAVVR